MFNMIKKIKVTMTGIVIFILGAVLTNVLIITGGKSYFIFKKLDLYFDLITLRFIEFMPLILSILFVFVKPKFLFENKLIGSFVTIFYRFAIVFIIFYLGSIFIEKTDYKLFAQLNYYSFNQEDYNRVAEIIKHENYSKIAVAVDSKVYFLEEREDIINDALIKNNIAFARSLSH